MCLKQLQVRTLLIVKVSLRQQLCSVSELTLCASEQQQKSVWFLNFHRFCVQLLFRVYYANALCGHVLHAAIPELVLLCLL